MSLRHTNSFIIRTNVSVAHVQYWSGDTSVVHCFPRGSVLSVPFVLSVLFVLHISIVRTASPPQRALLSAPIYLQSLSEWFMLAFTHECTFFLRWISDSSHLQRERDKREPLMQDRSHVSSRFLCLILSLLNHDQQAGTMSCL